MKPKLILCLALVLSGGLLGCSTAVDTASDPVWVKLLQTEHRHDKFHSMVCIEGKVVTVHKTSNILKSITVEVTPWKTTLGVLGKPWGTVVIHFDEPVSKLGSLELATGGIVRLVVFTINNGSNRPDELGSSCSSLGVKQNGAFYYSNGEKID